MYFPTEIIDMIVALSQPELLLTFTLVSKRYSKILCWKTQVRAQAKTKVQDDSFEYLCLKSPERYFKDQGQYIRILRDQAICRSSFTPPCNLRRMISHVPFGHPKFNKQLLTKKKFNFINRSLVCLHQDLDSTFKIFKMMDAPLTKEFFGSLMGNHRYSVFLACVSSILKSMWRSNTLDVSVLIYSKASSYERLEFLLANKIFLSTWNSFLSSSDDLDMYKRVYQIHIDNGYKPQCTVLPRILRAKKRVVKWIITIFNLTITSSRIDWKIKWDVKTVLYLYKIKMIEKRDIFDNLGHTNLCRVEDLSKKIGLFPLTIILRANPPILIIKKWYKGSGKIPTLKDLLLVPNTGHSQIYEWMMRELNMTKTSLLLHVIKWKGLKSNFVKWLVSNPTSEILQTIIDAKSAKFLRHIIYDEKAVLTKSMIKDIYDSKDKKLIKEFECFLKHKKNELWNFINM